MSAANGFPVPKDAASVILVRGREGSAEAEVYLLRRHRKASFMRSSYVFPGGVADDGEGDPRLTAARELFEEAGVLLAGDASNAEALAQMRERLLAGESLSEILAGAGIELELDRLHYFAHWITPSAEPRRYSARFYVTVAPDGQEPSADNKETVDEVWVTPSEALERAGELRLPPPQVHTFAALREAGGIAGILNEARARADRPHAIMPRFCAVGSGFALLLPWDPDYESRGTGDLLTMAADHPLATGPSRFVLEDDTWKNVHAPEPPTV